MGIDTRSAPSLETIGVREIDSFERIIILRRVREDLIYLSGTYYLLISPRCRFSVVSGYAASVTTAAHVLGRT